MDSDLFGEYPYPSFEQLGQEVQLEELAYFSAIHLCRWLRSAPDHGIVSIHITVDFQCRVILRAYLRKIYVRK